MVTIKKPEILKRMSKNKIILLLFFVSSFVKTQTNFSWYPVHPGTQYNYKTNISALPLSHVIKTDSISNGVNPIFYLNKIVSSCDTCHNSSLLNDPFDSTYSLTQQPQFLNHHFYKISGNGFYFSGPHSFQIYPFGLVGSSWLFDSTSAISATLLSRYQQSVFGTPDSMCVIRLSNSDTLILSKNHGFIRFPILTGVNEHYDLVGLEGSTNAGLKLKRFHDFFNFNPGNVLNYSFLEEDYNILPPLLKRGHERWEFLTVITYPDSVFCTIRNTHFDSLKLAGNPATITAYTHTFQLTFRDSVNHLANFYPLQEISVNPYFIFDNGIPHIHKVLTGINSSGQHTKTFGQVCPALYLQGGMTGAAMETPYSTVYLNKNSAKITGRELTEGLGFTSELFNDYSYIYQRCLSGYIKGTDTVGTIYADPLSVKNPEAIERYKIYPNPGDNFIQITGLSREISSLSIFNSLGEKVEDLLLNNSSALYTINTSQLKNGLYFIVISNHYLTETKKLFIQH